MRKRFITIIAVAFIGSAVAQAQSAPFTISLPAGYAEFTKQVQTTKAAEGEIETTNWIAKAPTGEAVIVTSSRMPGKILDPQKMIDSTRASLLGTLKATLESEEPRPGELPSTRMLFRSDAALFRARFTVSDDRLYQLLYVGRSEAQRSAPAVAAMFDSFRLTETGAAAQP
ncbi:MAG TPA: hypothetical protein VF266_05955 [Thermoanaerobaculia bacterium]